MGHTEITYCNVDKLFYIRHNDEDIHYQQTKPNDTDILFGNTVNYKHINT